MSNATTHTPARGGRTPAAELIAGADLPEPIARRIAGIIGATRLWKSERAEIARELIAHAQDALGAGHTPEEAAGALGDPKTIAPLLRRSAKRKRPWHWQIHHRALQAVGISILAVFATYAVLFVRFNIGSPSVTHNYLAELNQHNNAFTEDQKALPVFEQLQSAWRPEFMTLLEAAPELERATPEEDSAALHNLPIALLGDPGYESLIAAYQRVRPQVNAAIDASARPTLGVLYSDRQEAVLDEHGHQYFRVLPPTEDPSQAGLVIEVLLPFAGNARQIAKLIAFDAIIAAGTEDPDRTTRALNAVFRTAGLMARERFLICSLVALAIQSEGERTLLHILVHHPDLLSAEQLTEIAHTLTTSARAAHDMDFDAERLMFDDFMQRAFTDDGRGDGRLTPAGLQLLNELQSPRFQDTDLPLIANPDAVARVTGPLASIAMGSRKEQSAMYDRLLALVASALRESPTANAHQLRRAEIAELEAEVNASSRYRMIATLMPVFLKVVDSAHQSQAHTNAVLTTTALHIHHQRTGRWPDTLAELTPHLLPTIPEDPFDPGRPIKYRLIDGVPHIYFVGSNGQDNQARRADDKYINSISSLSDRYTHAHSTAPEFQADWIIFPPNPLP